MNVTIGVMVVAYSLSRLGKLATTNERALIVRALAALTTFAMVFAEWLRMF